MKQSHFNVSSQNFVSVTHNSRRSANYKPNIWKHHFLQSLHTKYHKEEFVMLLNKRVMEVKSVFAQETDILKQLELVDWIQKLGLANHFQKEINGFLESILAYVKTSNVNLNTQQDLHVSALCFRLLRNHGYAVLPDTLGKFLDKNGKVKRRMSADGGDVKDVVELLEASHLGLEGEKILDKAKTCAINSLKDSFCSINKDQLSDTVDDERMDHSLELPSHWRVQWFEVKWHVKQYSKEKNMNPVLLELSKLNFNMIQATLQLELKELSRWWENLGIKEELSFARNRLVESFMCAAGVASEPKYRSIRKWLTKVIVFVLVIDDAYDIHASFQELKPFTMAFERWEDTDTELEELPTYMKTCVHALKDVTNEIAYEIGGEDNFHLVLHYLKKAWIEFFKALYEEAKWYNQGYIPSLQEYLSNAWISSSGPVILLHSYLGTVYQVNDSMEHFLHTYEDLVYNVSLVIRLCNDLGTMVAERERGDAASSIVCYMNEKGVSEEKARKHIGDKIFEAWKKINEKCFASSSSCSWMEPFVTQAINAARVGHTLYQNGDGFGIQDQDIKKHILSLVVEPL
ncbi:alpha-farnesene synthase-like [Vigna unguiculata]|uniref:alpha-farnesene synthase-like n=1 Tax=Vigna unguiculata TaxID=3917 RepID=UPI0010166AFA|nr:alpha-farnesene synthase-like [Vigna unguiculata]